MNLEEKRAGKGIRIRRETQKNNLVIRERVRSPQVIFKGRIPERRLSEGREEEKSQRRGMGEKVPFKVERIRHKR